ncbi:hypothetical protein BLA28_23915 [Eisenbergiella tayi]|nr:hypothetical protein BLA28_23915 [Eisenbergiella tayi]
MRNIQRLIFKALNPAIFDKKSALSDWHGDIEDAKIITDTAIPALRPGWGISSKKSMKSREGNRQ